MKKVLIIIGLLGVIGFQAMKIKQLKHDLEMAEYKYDNLFMDDGTFILDMED